MTELELSAVRALMKEAAANHSKGDNAVAVSLYDRAIQACDRSASRDLPVINALAESCFSKANALTNLKDVRGAVRSYNRAIALWEPLVEEESHNELAGSLAAAYLNTGIRMMDFDDLKGCVGAFDRAIQIYVRMETEDGQLASRGDLLIVKVLCAEAQVRLRRDPDRAVEELRQSMAGLEREAERTGEDKRRDGVLNAARRFLDSEKCRDILHGWEILRAQPQLRAESTTSEGAPAGYGVNDAVPVRCWDLWGTGPERKNIYLARLRCPAGRPVHYKRRAGIGAGGEGIAGKVLIQMIDKDITEIDGYFEGTPEQAFKKLQQGENVVITRKQSEMWRLLDELRPCPSFQVYTIDAYEVTCECGEHSLMVYMDYYHAGPDAPIDVRGWTLADSPWD